MTVSQSPESVTSTGSDATADAPRTSSRRATFARYAFAVIAVFASLSLKLLLQRLIGDERPFLIFFVAVIGAAWYGGTRPGLVAVLLSALVADYLFIEPVRSFSVTSPGVMLELLLFAIEGSLVAFTLGSLRSALERSEQSEARSRESAARLDESAERLRAALRRLDFHVDQSPLGVVEWDSDFRIARWSHGAERLFGWTAEEVTGRRYEDWRFILEDDLESVRAMGRRLLKPDGQPNVSRNRNYTKDGRIVHCEWYNSALLDADGQLDSVLSLVLDTTARDTALANLAASEERYRAFVAQSSEGIWRFEITEPISTHASVREQIDAIFAHGYLAECNDLMARMYGYERADEIIGAPVSRLLERSAENIAYLEAFITSGYRLTDAETIETTKHGETRHFSNNLIGVVEPDDTIRRAWGTQRDVTAARRAEEERARLLVREQIARREAENSNRMKDEFLATLSHELRTPLTPIIGWTQLMRRGTLSAHELDRGTLVINKNAVALANLINDLLDMSAIINGKLRIDFESVDIASVIREAADTAQTQAEARGITIEVDPSALEKDLIVLGDRTRLTQIFWNLLSNAVKFSDNNGRIRISCNADPSRVRVHVEDEGIGIVPDFLPHVFSRFRQADQSSTRSYGGLGLGLALVKSFAEAHHGSVTAESAGAGRGSRFTIELPRFVSAAHDTTGMRDGDAMEVIDIAQGKDHAELYTPVAPAQTENNSQSAQSHTLPAAPHILIAEDSADTLELLRAIFMRAGYRVTTCVDAHEALRAAEADTFDLLVTDIGMPDMNGYDLLAALHQRARDAGVSAPPALALTGYASERDAEATRRAGFDRHVAKPVDPYELLASVRDLLARNQA